MNVSTAADLCIGASVCKKAFHLPLRHPVENRMITDFDDF
jgi:hypothetical protein